MAVLRLQAEKYLNAQGRHVSYYEKQIFFLSF